ncbi:RidA family protein [Dyadobacter jiangsuensis]|uniref:Enamine deaminase RidA (YjgF/YER057c/UK114 family) n=1 Tax=Dyadobacter jiangsuensis TaxID=1591085 RepID=A0A2P8GJC4_9BACT|nr:RidA family protein [Dyadobacter jiangsuensis]PSL34075.1 enamine deaminase RidA (YjgF/YER057c/UK114 family) [Dyadobacter jiangsuensis]
MRFKSTSLAAALLLALTVSFHAVAQTGRPDPEKKLTEMGITLPKINPGKGNLLRTVRVGNLVYLSGHGPDKPGGGQILGKVGDDLTVEQGKEAAKLCGIGLLASLKHEIGDLKKVKRVIKVLGMVNSTPTLTQQPQVINGFTDFMVEVFGESGKHARSAVGVASLPSGIAVEIEMIVEVEP